MSTTITSLLNSLHTHLQSQTQLLPALHNQLGLPPTALADELSTLQKQLTECVESQIALRRAQVDEWTCKCEEVEKDCLRYSKALGGHMKATGSSVGEVRKEQVLPKRFEMITEYQEKLRQLYHTKLEQLLTISNRLAQLSRTLGPEFFASDILEPSAATGESEVDPSSNRDVTPERFSKLEKELVRGKGEVSKRLNQLSATMVQIDWLHTELGITPPSVEDLTSPASSTAFLRVPSISRPPSSCSSLTASTSSSSDPFLTSTPTPMTRSKTNTPFLLISSSSSSNDSPPSSESEHIQYQRIFSRFVARVEELTDEELADANKLSIGLEGVDPSPGLVSWAESTRASLEDLKRKRETHIQAMYDQLEALWRRLGVADKDMDAFVEAQRGSTEDTVRAYEEELDRMLDLKRERMSTFVENARDEIRKLWDELMIGEDERVDFAPFADDEHTEELLSIHEEEIRRLKEDRRAKGSLLAGIKKYFDICEDEKELAASASDQTRLLSRGPRDPGRLLREEKMRKRVTKEKPRLEQDLLSSIPAWEAEAGRVFLVHGQSILQILMNATGANEKENGNKRGKSQTRAGSVPPRSKTPSNAANNLAPVPNTTHGARNSRSATPAMRPSTSMSSSRSGPSRRAKLGEATTSYNNAPPVPLVPPVGHVALNKSNGPAFNRPPSPSSKIPSKTPLLSSLPRPVPIAMPVPRSGSQHRTLGHGRAPSSHSHSYHPYPRTQRSSSSSSATSHRVYGAMALNTQMTAGAARKASRVRRESFKPRPSMDDGWNAGGGTDKRWAGFAGGAVREEEEDF